MKFSTFLLEQNTGTYKNKELTGEEALDLFNKHCKNMDFTKPFWRGMRGMVPAYILRGRDGKRVSVDLSNHYTKIIDHMIDEYGKADYPKRSESIICITNNGRGTTKKFGDDVYAIFPYDDSVIGICPSDDIWGTYYTLNDTSYSILTLNTLYKANDIDDGSYKDIIDGLTKFMADESNIGNELYDIYDGLDIEDTFKKIYYDQFDFVKSNKMTYNDNELWISDHCIAIKYNEWVKLKELRKVNAI